MTLGSTSEGMIISLTTVADGSSLWLLPLRISLGFDFHFIADLCVSEPFTIALSAVADGVEFFRSRRRGWEKR